MEQGAARYLMCSPEIVGNFTFSLTKIADSVSRGGRISFTQRERDVGRTAQKGKKGGEKYLGETGTPRGEGRNYFSRRKVNHDQTLVVGGPETRVPTLSSDLFLSDT